MIAALMILALLLNLTVGGLGAAFLVTTEEGVDGRGFATIMASAGALSFGLFLALLLGVTV